MRYSIFILFVLLLGHQVVSQNTPASLSRQLTVPCKNDREKVSAIFRWITDNISYMIASRPGKKKIGESPRIFSKYEDGITEDTGALKPLNERVAIEVLKRREAVCDGYARLFSTLCDYAGIKSEVIVGYARGNVNKPSLKFGVNHYWNAVFFEETWHLLDATWASGYIKSNSGEYSKEYDSKYFLTNPTVFIQDHYPDDIRWTLLPDSEIPVEFSYSPFKQKSFVKYNISSFFPKKGIIEASLGDTIRLELTTADAEKDKKISPSMLIDSSLFSQSASWVFLKPNIPDNSSISNSYTYYYTVSSDKLEWLYLLYNDDMVLRYKVKVKKKKI